MEDLFHFNYDNNCVAIPHDLTADGSSIYGYLPQWIFSALRIRYRKFAYLTGAKTSPYKVYDLSQMIFVHIPKNAGTYINDKLFPGFEGDVTEVLAHHSVRYLSLLDRKKYKAYPKVAIIRNPATRLESAFNYIKFDSPFFGDKKFSLETLHGIDNFDEFMRKLQEDQSFRQKLKLAHFRPQCEFIISEEKALDADILICFERMKESFEYLCYNNKLDWPVIEFKEISSPTNDSIHLARELYPLDFQLWDRLNECRAGVWVR